jgi:hypothetical protein
VPVAVSGIEHLQINAYMGSRHRMASVVVDDEAVELS